MMRPTQEVTVYLHRQPVDFCKAINGLSFIVQEDMKLNAYSEALFVFINKNYTKLKLLYWERNGFCLWQKRLEKNKFAWPRHLEDDILQLRERELNWLLDGFDIWRMPPRQTFFRNALLSLPDCWLIRPRAYRCGIRLE